jgi:5-methylthioadenosine/S-adenosylhomocysteine deaminase
MSSTTHIKNAAWVIAWEKEAERHVYMRDADVVFTGNTIDFVGKGYEGRADTVIDGAGLVVMPGLVNLHSHPLHEPIYRGFSEELGNPKLYQSGLYDLKPLLRISDPSGMPVSAQVAFCEMLLSGMTTVADLSFPHPGWVERAADSGLRVYIAPMYRQATWYSENGHEIKFHWDEEAGAKGFKESVKVCEEAESHPSGRLKAMLCPAQIDTCTEEFFQESQALAKDRNWPLQTHIAQSVVEFNEMTRRHGVTPVQWAHRIGITGPGTILSHVVFIDEHSWLHWPTCDDLNILADTGTSVAHCPMVISRYGLTMEHLGKYINGGINVGMGMDTQPQNMIEEMRCAAYHGRIAAGQIHCLTTGQVFHAATAAGAKALGRDDIGGLAAGMKADIVLVDAEHPLMKPLRDPLRSLIYSAADRAVRDVYVDGNLVVENRKVLTIDQRAACERMQEIQAAVGEQSVKLDHAGRTLEEVSPLVLPMA